MSKKKSSSTVIDDYLVVIRKMIDNDHLLSNSLRLAEIEESYFLRQLRLLIEHKLTTTGKPLITNQEVLELISRMKLSTIFININGEIEETKIQD